MATKRFQFICLDNPHDHYLNEAVVPRNNIIVIHTCSLFHVTDGNIYMFTIMIITNIMRLTWSNASFHKNNIVYVLIMTFTMYTHNCLQCHSFNTN